MRIFRLLLVCLLLHVKLYAQQTKSLNISVRNVPLETVLAQIKKQTGVSFFYKKEVLKNVGKITVEAKNATLKTVLDQCLEDTQIGYTIVGNVVTLAVRTAKGANSEKQLESDNSSQSSVKGMVYNSRGERLSGANVIVRRTRQGTITNAGGEFSLRNVRANDTLVISYMGYEPQERPVFSQTEFNVQLKETTNALDAVEVQAYGTTTKRLAIGEISQITAKDIERQPVPNVMLAVKSLVPGLMITQTNGYSNSPVKVEIRGRNSIDPTSVSDPLYIIDGVPLIQANIGRQASSYESGSTGLQQAGITVSGGQSPLSNINPNDIESITVLKDAAATAMYGSRAGNGVIIINTKKGKPGKTQLNATVNMNINSVSGHQSMLNTSQYLEMRREALRNDGLTPTVDNAPDVVAWGDQRNTDWQKVLWKAANSTNAQANLSGGSEQTTFRISGNYSALKEVSPLQAPITNKSGNVSFNLTHYGLERRLSLDLSASYGSNAANQIGNGGATTLAPNLPPIFDDRGNLNYADWNAVNLGDSFPFPQLMIPSKSNSDFLNASFRVGFEVLKGLNVSAIVGYNLGLNKNSYATTIRSQNPVTNPTGQTILGNSRTDGWNVTPQIDYSLYLGKGKLTALLGGNLNSTSASGITIFAMGYTSDQMAKSINNAPYFSTYQDYAQSKYIDVHASLNYIWDGKYIVELSGNRDGSSNFGPGRQFGTFGVAGASWIASEEKWVKKALPKWVSLIKLKGSYGTTGTYPNIAYQYLSQWAISAEGLGGTPIPSYNGVVPQVPIHAVNQDYRWETVRQLNVAFDIAFLDDRIALHGAIYRKRSDNQLSNLPTPLFTGFNSIFGNSSASVQNSGLELSLSGRLIDAKDFSWSATLNFGQNRNKLLAFPGIEFTPYYTTQLVGKSLNSVYLFHYKGVDPQTGQRSYEDFNGDGHISYFNSGPPGSGADDRVIAWDLSPKFETSLVNQFSYKKLLVSFHLAYRKKKSLIPYTATAGRFNVNIPQDVFDNHWQKPGDITPNPRFTTRPSGNESFFASSDGAYTDASYLRLQNIALSYALPQKLSKKIGTQQISLMLSMQNVLTFSRYPGTDPELAFGSQPQSRTINGQLTFTF